MDRVRNNPVGRSATPPPVPPRREISLGGRDIAVTNATPKSGGPKAPPVMQHSTPPSLPPVPARRTQNASSLSRQSSSEETTKAERRSAIGGTSNSVGSKEWQDEVSNYRDLLFGANGEPEKNTIGGREPLATILLSHHKDSSNLHTSDIRNKFVRNRAGVTPYFICDEKGNTHWAILTSVESGPNEQPSYQPVVDGVPIKFQAMNGNPKFEIARALLTPHLLGKHHNKNDDKTVYYASTSGDFHGQGEQLRNLHAQSIDSGANNINKVLSETIPNTMGISKKTLPQLKEKLLEYTRKKYNGSFEDYLDKSSKGSGDVTSRDFHKFVEGFKQCIAMGPTLKKGAQSHESRGSSPSKKSSSPKGSPPPARASSPSRFFQRIANKITGRSPSPSSRSNNKATKS